MPSAGREGGSRQKGVIWAVSMEGLQKGTMQNAIVGTRLFCQSQLNPANFVSAEYFQMCSKSNQKEMGWNPCIPPSRQCITASTSNSSFLSHRLSAYFYFYIPWNKALHQFSPRKLTHQKRKCFPVVHFRQRVPQIPPPPEMEPLAPRFLGWSRLQGLICAMNKWGAPTEHRNSIILPLPISQNLTQQLGMTFTSFF